MSGRPWERDGRRSGFAGLVGLRVLSGERGEAVVSCEVGEDHLNVGGTVHGGVIATLVDVAVGVACHTMDAERPGRAMATTELSITFLQPSSAGPLTCRAKIRRRGRSLAVGEAEVSDAGGRLMALGRATYLVGGAGPAPGRSPADDSLGLTTDT